MDLLAFYFGSRRLFLVLKIQKHALAFQVAVRLLRLLWNQHLSQDSVARLAVLNEEVLKVLVIKGSDDSVLARDVRSNLLFDILGRHALVLVLLTHLLLPLVFQLKHPIVQTGPQALSGDLARAHEDTCIPFVPARVADEREDLFSLMLGQLELIESL